VPTLNRLSGSTVSLTLRIVIIALAVHGALELARAALAQEEHTAYLPVTQNPGSLDDRVSALEYKLANVAASTGAITVTGANLYVVNGTGTTDGEPNGLGNLIVGYNHVEYQSGDLGDRAGSHMLIIGDDNSYTGYGGLIVGTANETRGPAASVIGGIGNAALGDHSVVVGGSLNFASVERSVVLGGRDNRAAGVSSIVSGGEDNNATGEGSVVCGGLGNQSHGKLSTVVGGDTNQAIGSHSVVNGGQFNEAVGRFSSVSGGSNRAAHSDFNWVAGSLLEER
jgi:hypothetical protein